MKLRGLVFDFDGLILDTEAPFFQSWQEIYQEHGCTLSETLWRTHIGRGHGDIPFDPYQDLETQLGQPIDRDAIRLRRRHRQDELIAQQELLPGVAQYLLDAQRLSLKLAVASSSLQSWVDRHLSRFALTHFECIRCRDHVAERKPHPEVYLSALLALGLTADEVIAFEDSPNGIQSAKQAGIFTVAVPNPLTRSLDLSRADMRIESLAEVPLQQLLSTVTAGRHPEAL